MGHFQFEVLKHYHNLEIQINAKCEEPFCPFQNTKLCKRVILKLILQRRDIVVSEVKLTHGEYLIQLYLDKEKFKALKPIFRDIDEHVDQIRNPKKHQKKKAVGDPVKDKNVLKPSIPPKKNISIQKKKLKEAEKPKRREFDNKDVIFKWIKKNYNSDCAPSNNEGQYFLVNAAKVVGYIILNYKDKKYSVKELNLVDADLKLE